MLKSFYLTLYHLRDNWRTRLLAFLVVVPLAAFILLSLPQLAEADLQVFAKFSFSIVEDEPSMIASLIEDQLSKIEIIETIYLDTADKAQERLAADEILLVLYLPEGFARQFVSGSHKDAMLVQLNPNMPTEAAMFVQFFKDLSHSLTFVQAAYFSYAELAWPVYPDQASYNKALEAAFLHIFLKSLGRHAAVEIADVRQFQKDIFVINSFLCSFILLLALQDFLSIQQEKNNNLLVRQLAAGVRWWEQLLARQLASTIWLLASFMPLLLLLRRFFPELALFPLVGGISLLYWTGSALLQAYSLYGTSNASGIIGAWLFVFLFLLLGGCIYPLLLLPRWLNIFCYISPAFWAGGIISQSLGGPAAAKGLLWACPLLLLCSSFFFYLASRRQAGKKIFRRTARS